MFDYVNRMQLALGDKARRAGMKAGAGVVLLIGAGFLLAALWSWIAWELRLGPIWASGIIGGVCVLIGLILWLLSAAEHHPVPTTDELKAEVEARLSLATDAAIGKVRHSAESAISGAKSRAFSFLGATGAQAGKVAEGAEDLASDAAGKVGETLEDARETLDRAVATKAGPAIGIAGAFALGVILAGALKRSGTEDYDDWEDWDDDYE